MKPRLIVLLGLVAGLPCVSAAKSQTPGASEGYGQSGTQSRSQTTAQMQAADAAFREGSAAFERNDLAAAQASFEKVVRLAPAIAAAHSALGTVLIAAGNPSRAVTELETARKLGGSDRSTLLNLCIAYSNLGNYRGTLGVFRQMAAGANDPLPADAAVAVATAFSETGDAAGAEAVLRTALDGGGASNDDNARLHDSLGTVFAQRRLYTEAEAEFHRAIALDETRASAHYRLGLVQLATNRPTAAVPELERAHALQPESVPYAVDLSRALLATGQDAQAIDLLRAMLAHTPAAPQGINLKYQLALALQSAGQTKEAMPLFAEAVEARPEDAQVLTNAALCKVQLGDAKGAVPLYLRALKLAPSDATVHEDLGVAYLQQADLDHALEQFRAGLAIEANNPQLHYDLGLALKLKDDLAAAVPEFQRAAELDPSLPDPPYTLGILFMQQGQFEKSAASLEQATQLRPDNGEAWATLGSVYQQMQQPDKAVPALRQAIALLPQQPSPHINLAAILASQGHKEEAAAERKIGAELTRAAVNRQKAEFGLDSGNLLMKRGQNADALAQFQSAVEADPGYAAPHLALAAALDRAGRKAEAAEERRKAAALEAAAGKPSQ